MKYVAAVPDDLTRAEGAPSLAEKRGRDVIVVRVGAPPIDEARTHRAGVAIRALASKRE